MGVGVWKGDLMCDLGNEMVGFQTTLNRLKISRGPTLIQALLASDRPMEATEAVYVHKYMNHREKKTYIHITRNTKKKT